MKDPKDMNIEELKLLLEIRKLELKNSLMELQNNLQWGYRILRGIQKSGVLEMVFSKEDKKDKTHPSRNQSEKSSSKKNQKPKSQKNRNE